MRPNIESDLLRTFIAVAETSNFTRAGEIVGRTQSAVSMQVKKLEEGVGTALFERGSRGVLLTKQGGELLAQARRIIALLDETANSMRKPHLKGSVRIGIPEEYGSSVLPAALAAFDKLHSGVEVTVKFGRSELHVEALNAGHMDLAIVYERGDFTQSEVLFTDPTVWATSILHETHLQTPLPIAIYSHRGWCVPAALATLEGSHEPYRISYVSDTSGGLFPAVQSGLAIAPLARSSIPVNCRELTMADGFPVIDQSNVVLRFARRPISDATRGMADAIRDAFNPMRSSALARGYAG